MNKLFIALLCLNLFDTGATFIGLKLEVIEEANPLMHVIYEKDPLLFVMLKLMFSLLLLFFILKKDSITSMIVKYLSITAIIGYFFVFAVHIFWIVQYIWTSQW